MSRRSKSIRFFNFSGGLNTKSAATSLMYNEAIDLQNINLLPSHVTAGGYMAADRLSANSQEKCGFQKRFGNSVHNSSAMNSGANIQGVGYFRKSDLTDAIFAVAGAKFYGDVSLSGTMTERTGAVTITAAQDDLWTFSMMNDLVIGVGGAPDAPFKWTGGANNIAVLGGSPVSANFGIAANNRMFLGNTAANPSTIYWSILGNPEDWSAAGSGSQDVQKNDGDTLVGASQAGPNHMLLFKQNSIHDLVINSAPFPLFPLFRGVGAVSKRGIVNVGDMIYFITPQPRMKATDGVRVYDFPDTIDGVWDGLNATYLNTIQGVYYPKRRQIMWFVRNGTSTTQNLCIIWDLARNCWLRHTTGHSMNSVCIAKDRLLYGGAYDGKLYKQDDSTTSNDASEAGAAINGYWKTGWYDLDAMINQKNVPYVDVNFTLQAAGTFDFGIGYDFTAATSNKSIDMSKNNSYWNTSYWNQFNWNGGQTDRSALVFTKGRGKFVQFFIRNQNASESFSFNGFEVPIKEDAPSALR